MGPPFKDFCEASLFVWARLANSARPPCYFARRALAGQWVNSELVIDTNPKRQRGNGRFSLADASG